jgi:transposase
MGEGDMARQLQGKRKGIRMINEIARMSAKGISQMKIASALNISRNTVRKYLNINKKCLDNVTLDSNCREYQAPFAEFVDWKSVRSKTDRGVQLRVIWEEDLLTSTHIALKTVPYVSFWREYKRRYPLIPLHLHKNHPPGERCEIDYKGDAKGLCYFDRETGEHVQCKLFGAVLCFSQLFFARATLTEKQGDIFTGIAKSFEYFKGVPATVAVDNTKTLVNKAHRYDPELNPEFKYFCDHYGTSPLAMRPRKPKDKNLIENALGVFWRWAEPKVREQQFGSLLEINSFLRSLVDTFNKRIMSKYQQSRQEKFLGGEANKLGQLPEYQYQFGQWKESQVHPDCHIQICHNFYSVPYQLRGSSVDVRLSTQYLEVFSKLERIAIHRILSTSSRGRYVTNQAHLPESHLAINEFTVKRAHQDAERIGVATYVVVSNLLTKSSHPLMYLRRCQGILRLAQRYSADSLEKSCEYIVNLGIEMPRLKDIEQIAKNHIFFQEDTKSQIVRNPNPNLRGQLSWSQQ